jgi:SAM-dependent methyltransferase
MTPRRDDFSHLRQIDGKYDDRNILRMQLRRRFIIDAYEDEVEGARVLDLASHDGRWCHAWACAGADQVDGVEGRPELVRQFQKFPKPPCPVDLQCGDIFEFLEEKARTGATYDVVGVLGIFYHITDHYRLLRLVSQLKPRLIVIDGEFATAPGAIVSFAEEDPSKDVNTTAVTERGKVPVGIPSVKVTELWAKCLDYSVEWANWHSVAEAQRGAVGDYFREGNKRRFTCALRPLSS